MRPDSSMYRGLARLRDSGFVPTGVLDVGAHEGDFSRGARQLFPEARILMIEALAEKAPLLARTCEDIGDADYLITMLGEAERDETPFFVVDTAARPDLVTTGSSKFKENSVFPMTRRVLPQRALADVLAGRDEAFPLLKLDVQGAELDVLRGLRHRLSGVEAIVMELSLVDYNEGAPPLDFVLSEVRKMGFVLLDIVGEHRYRGDRLIQIDDVFARPSASFRPRPPFWD